ncbi:MAG TPA: glycosyltransferase [Ktedonobacterales bacterium]
MKTPRRPRTILFLIADTGAGHRSAANAINRALEVIEQEAVASATVVATRTAAHEGRGTHRNSARAHHNHRTSYTPASSSATIQTQPAQQLQHSPMWRTVIVDVFAECSQFPLRNGMFLYGPAIKHSPRLYGQLFRMTNTVERFDAARRIAQPFLRQGLRRLIERTRPDVIVSIHPLLNHVTLQVLRDIGLRIPFLTVVTDLVSIHCAWLAPGVDACVVPTEAGKRLALGSGVAPKRIHMLGMPIDPKFAHQPQDTREERRARLGLDPDKPVVLVVGGGEGAGGLAEAAVALGSARLPAQLVVITGRNQQLRARLERQRTRFKTPVHVEGFVHNMPDFMWAADVIVTKAGPGSISEAMACELPIALTGAVPGQEEGNIDYVLDNGLGELATSPGELVATLRALLNPNNSSLAKMRERVRALSHPTASFDIGKLILSYLPPANAPSVWESLRHRSTARIQRIGRRRTGLTVRPPFPRDLLPRLTGAAAHARRTPRRLISMRPLSLRRSPLGSVTRYRLLELTNLASVRSLLRRTGGENLQLWRSGGHRGRYDAWPARRSGGD